MFKSVFRTIPLFISFITLLSFLYIVTSIGITGDLNTVIDVIQIHTSIIGGMIFLLSLSLWGGSIYLFEKKGWMMPLYESKIYRVLTAFLIAVLIGTIGAYVFLAYHIDIEQIGKTTEWIQEYLTRFIFTAFLLSLITLVIILLVGEVYLGAGLALFTYFILAMVNYYKQVYRNEPLFPNDFIQVGQMKDVIPLISDSISLPITLGIAIGVIIAVAVWFKMPKIKLGWISRLIILLPLGFVLYSFLFYEDTFAESYYEEYTSFMPWNQNNNYYYNGPVLGMVSNIKLDVVQEPDRYNEKVLEASVVQAEELTVENSPAEEETVKPNIIFLLNETFWDPTRLDVHFSEDPMPNIRKLMGEYPSGTFFSPVFGGETANTEFELLTSYSMNFINPGGNPFNHILANDQYPSIVSHLNDEGYYSEAIHPNSGNLYRRQRVYPNLGFDSWKFLKDMTYTEKDNSEFVSDQSVVNELLDTIEQQEDPSFIHAVTIANHLPYPKDKYEGGSTIDVKGESLSDDSERMLEVYAEGIKRSDAALNQLNEEIQALDEPTLIVFYGDHLPSLGSNLKAYREAGFGTAEDLQTNAKFYETPLLVLSNFDTGLEEDLGTLSPIYLAPMISEALGLESPPFYDFMNEMRGEIPAFRNRIYMDDEGETVESSDQLPSSTQSVLSDYHQFQFDVLSGKQHVIEQLYNTP